MRLFVVCGSPPESSRAVVAADQDRRPSRPGPDCPRRRRRVRAAPRALSHRDLEHELAVLLAGLEPRCASWTSSSGRTESTSGRMRPCAKSRVTARNSESLAIVEPSTSSCFQKIRCRPRGRVPARRRTRQHEAPAAAERLDRRRPGVGADVLVDDVDAAPARDLPDGRQHVVAAVVDGRDRAALARDREHVVARGRRDHARPERRGERDGGAADAGAGAPHEHPLARLQARARHQHAPGGREHERIGGRLGEAQRLGLRVEVARRARRSSRHACPARARRARRSARTATAGRAGRPRRRRRRGPG